MAAGSTYTPIATNTLSSATSSITFSSIPSTYTDLVLVTNLLQASTPQRWLSYRLNGDTGTNYSYTNLQGNGSSTTSYKESSQTRGIILFNTPSTTAWGNSITSFNNYSNTTTYKTSISKGGNTANSAETTITLWRSTAAINTILLTLEGSGQNFEVGSSFTLYGIAAA